MTITPKYNIGDRVYHIGTTDSKHSHPCPDCLGSQKWSAKSPAGDEFTFDCPRCASFYQPYPELSLTYWKKVPYVQTLTIGSIQYDSAADEGEQFRYMCIETGIGSGSVYYEQKLFSDKALADAAAQLEADRINSETKHSVDRYNKSLNRSSLRMESAILKEAKEIEENAREYSANVRYLVSDLRNCKTIDEMNDTIDDYIKYRMPKEQIEKAKSEGDIR